MDFLFWIFIAILLIIGYNCLLKQKIPTEKSVETFYDNFIPLDQKRVESEQAQHQKNLQQQLHPASQRNFQHNLQQPLAQNYTATQKENAAQSASNYYIKNTQTQFDADVNAGLLNSQNTYSGVSDKSSLNYASLNDIPVAQNIETGIQKNEMLTGANQPYQSAVNSSRLQSKDLIPQGGDNNTWKKLNPDPEGWLEGRNFLQAGYHLGINTIGQSRKNANYQLRSEPANPRDQVSVWNQSQIDPDVRRCFELN